MQMITKHWAIIGIGFAAAVLIAFGWTHRAKAPMPSDIVAPAATSSMPLIKSVTIATSSAADFTPKPFPINPVDAIASWSFKGAYVGNATLVAQATSDIAHLTSLIGKGKYDDYDLYNGLANDAASLGDGQTAYHDYTLALAIHPSKGLAYTNLAHLMNQLGAYQTAADAYAKAVAVEPGMLEYHIERLAYLTSQFSKDTARVTAAFADASKQFGDTAQVLVLKARWLTQEGQTAEAIKAWQTVKTLSPGQDTTAIDAAIARLKAK